MQGHTYETEMTLLKKQNPSNKIMAILALLNTSLNFVNTLPKYGTCNISVMSSEMDNLASKKYVGKKQKRLPRLQIVC